MKNIWNWICLNPWFGFGISLVGGGIILTLDAGHLNGLVLLASSARANDPGLDLLNQYILIFKKLSYFSFVAALLCLAVGFWKLQKSKH
jgi:hypothetical protein